jgi:XRE family aerobic/anaerobic benzoate catabolism transcriptional regulator
MPRAPRTASPSRPKTGGAQDLLRRVGRAVRQERRARGHTRRALAGLSGVSERFLAQIEAGNGNVSLRRLDDLARALDVPFLRLLASPIGGDGPRVALIGLRGAGKSTVGARLARALKVPFLELDALIEEAAGLPLAQIFEMHGERYFRRLEREVLSRFAAGAGPAVLAAGGGLVTDPETFAILRASCRTIWLSATPRDHYRRVQAQGDRRPMAGSPDAMAELEALLAARRPLYAMADLTIDTSKVPVAEAVRRITAALKRGA